MNRHNEVKVGITVLIAIILLTLGVMWIKDVNFTRRTRAYQVLFPAVGSLGVGDRVAIAGVKKGEITDIELSGDKVLVSFWLEREVNLTQGSRFYVKNIGLMGERYLEVFLGPSTTPLAASPIPEGVFDPGIPEVMGMAGGILTRIDTMITILRGSVASPGVAEQIKTIATNLTDLTTDLRRVVKAEEGTLVRTLTQLDSSSARLARIAGQNEESVRRTVANADTLSSRARSLVTELDSVAHNLRSLASGIDRGEGTLGKLAKEDVLYNRLLGTVNNLDSLITDIKANPGRYITLKIF